jgi:hypothetical protein
MEIPQKIPSILYHHHSTIVSISNNSRYIIIIILPFDINLDSSRNDNCSSSHPMDVIKTNDDDL